MFIAWNHFQWTGIFYVWIIGQLLDNVLKQLEKQNLGPNYE